MIRLPQITSGTPQQQLAQIQSYLYQLVQDLEYSFSVSEQRIDIVKSEIPKSSGEKTPEEIEKSFSEIKALIIKSADIVEAYSEKIIGLIDLSGKYVAQSDFGTYMEETNQRLDVMDDGMISTSTKISTIDGNIQDIVKEQTKIKQSADAVEINVNNIIQHGATKVVTGSGYRFDDDGMHITKPDSNLRSKATNEGWTVSMAIGEEGTSGFEETKILEAVSDGVKAINVSVNQYLNIGENTRIQGYSDGGTGIFYVGGNQNGNSK